MTQEDKKEFAQIMAGLAENCGAQLSPAGLAFRFESLKEYSIDQIKNAAIHLGRVHKYANMPANSDFIDLMSGGSPEDIAEVEAAKVWQAMQDHGGTNSVCFDDPVTQAVIQNGHGGWQKMCAETMMDQRKWFFKDFAKTYCAYARQGMKHFGLLPGFAPRVDRGPYLVGDEHKAQAVLDAPRTKKALTHEKPINPEISLIVDNVATKGDVSNN